MMRKARCSNGNGQDMSSKQIYIFLKSGPSSTLQQQIHCLASTDFLTRNSEFFPRAREESTTHSLALGKDKLRETLFPPHTSRPQCCRKQREREPRKENILVKHSIFEC